MNQPTQLLEFGQGVAELFLKIKTLAGLRDCGHGVVVANGVQVLRVVGLQYGPVPSARPSDLERGAYDLNPVSSAAPAATKQPRWCPGGVGGVSTKPIHADLRLEQLHDGFKNGAPFYGGFVVAILFGDYRTVDVVVVAIVVVVVSVVVVGLFVMIRGASF